MNFKFNNDRNT